MEFLCGFVDRACVRAIAVLLWLALRFRRRRAANRTPDHHEVAIVRLHVEQRGFGAPKLRDLVERVMGRRFGVSTIRRVIGRRARVKHARTRPAHPWTNGRVERAFRTYKETLRPLVWMLSSFRQLERLSTDFVRWHNEHRPHMSNAGLTPEEVALGVRTPRRAVGRVMLFDGRMAAYEFG